MLIVGIDEVGRGCWAGPLVVGAVILNKQILGLKDSKLIPKKQKLILASKIKKEAVEYSLGWVNNKEIDVLGLTQATALAITRALDQIKINYDEVIIDGNTKFIEEYKAKRVKYLIKADQLIPSVSAASILAKVARDEYMTNLKDDYLKYQFSSHVGYGTKLHKDNLIKFGVSDLHRLSYKPIKELLSA